jgi:hypothetical protein
LRILARRVPDSVTREVVGGWMRCAFATAVMTAVTLAVGAFLPESSEWGPLAIHLAIKVTVAAGVYFAVSRFMRMPELGWILRRG